MTYSVPSFSTLESKLKEACESFLSADFKLFHAKAGERVLVSGLRSAMRDTFPSIWNVDDEYNRFGLEAKRSIIRSRKPTTNKRGHLVTPDIIVHERLLPTGGNLLAIEAKPEGRKVGITKDREKLASYLRRPLCYHYVALVVFSKTQTPWCSFELFSRRQDPKRPKDPVVIELKEERTKRKHDARTRTARPIFTD